PENLIPREAVVANCDYVGGGYGEPTDEMVEAIKLLAEYEGILLDPVYSGKGMAGLIDLIRKGHFKKGENIVFIHTGGNVGLFSYLENFSYPDSRSQTHAKTGTSTDKIRGKNDRTYCRGHWRHGARSHHRIDAMRPR